VLESHQNYLYQLAWQYNPHALMAVNSHLEIHLVNPAFCSLFQLDDNNCSGKLAREILGDVQHLQETWQTKKTITNQTREYVKPQIYVKESIFPIAEKDLMLCIMIDLTEDVQRKKELNQMQEEMIQKVNTVVNNQMKVAQEIAGLLGETTAETKVNLFKLLELFND
jgi:transcriptional regulator of aromatic amino acid metabolism